MQLEKPNNDHEYTGHYPVSIPTIDAAAKKEIVTSVESSLENKFYMYMKAGKAYLPIPETSVLGEFHERVYSSPVLLVELPMINK